MTMPSLLFDTHCHLQMPAFEQDLDQVLLNASRAGVHRIVVPGIDIPTSIQALELSEKHECLYAAVGIHPHYAASWNRQAATELKDLAQHPNAVAVGEVGLDYFRDHSPRDTQRKAFREQLDLAAELELPVIVHNRESTEDLLTILTQRDRRSPADNSPAGVLHAFSADLEAALKAIDFGFFIGFGGPLTFKKSEDLRAVAAEISLDHIVLETDAPYLAPHPNRGKRNEPAWINITAEVLADQFQATIDTVANSTTRNANILFQLNNE